MARLTHIMATTTRITIIMYIMYTASCSPPSESHLTTTLYPVNRTFDLKRQETNLYKHINTRDRNDSKNIKEQQVQSKIEDKKDDSNQINNEMVTKQHESTNEPENKQKEHLNHKTVESEEIVISDSQMKDNEQKTDGKSNAVVSAVKNEVTTWSLETNYSQADEKDAEKDLKEEQKKIIKEFRPSPHLGSFYDEDAFALTTQASVVPWSPHMKPLGFARSPQDFYKLNYKKPINPPYKFETYPPFPDPTYWKHHTGLESKPTDTVPVKTPAGSLYKSPEVFKDQPTSQEYGIYKEEATGNSHKKGLSPWKSFLHLASALLPVGLIVSALTPSVITLQTADNTPAPFYGHRITRRVEHKLPVLSEACKRRLLCELHAGHQHGEVISTGHKHCYKLQCEDPVAMMTVLRFVLTHRPPPPGVGGNPPGTVVPLG